MKTRAMVMLGLALLMAGVSVFLARSWIQNQVKPVAEVQQEQLKTTQVVVSTSQLRFGNKIRREHLRVVDWPASSIPEGSFKSIDQILGKETTENGKKVVPEDRVALRTIEVNEPILKGKITGFGGRASLSTLITPGMRATTIRMNDVNGVAGFVLPGDRVDILLTRDPKSTGRKGRNLTTEVLLQNMKVLGINQDANEDRTKPGVAKAVTFEVTTTQAQKLTLAQRLGSLSLALRHVNTVDAFEPVSISARDLRVGEANLAPKPKVGGVESAPAVISEAALTESAPADVVINRAPEKKAVVTATVTEKKKKKLSSVTIVRGLTPKEYEVEPEKPTFSAPAYSKPLNILPSKLTPSIEPIMPAKLAPMSPPTKTLSPTVKSLSPTMTLSPSMGGATEDAKKNEPSSEPVSLLNNNSSLGNDG